MMGLVVEKELDKKGGAREESMTLGSKFPLTTNGSMTPRVSPFREIRASPYRALLWASHFKEIKFAIASTFDN